MDMYTYVCCIGVHTCLYLHICTHVYTQTTNCAKWYEGKEMRDVLEPGVAENGFPKGGTLGLRPEGR